MYFETLLHRLHTIWSHGDVRLTKVRFCAIEEEEQAVWGAGVRDHLFLPCGLRVRGLVAFTARRVQLPSNPLYRFFRKLTGNTHSHHDHQRVLRRTFVTSSVKRVFPSYIPRH